MSAAGHLKHREPSRAENPEELLDVLGGEIGWDVLEGDGAIDEVEGIVVEHVEVGDGVDQVLYALAVPVVLIGPLNHGLGDVHTDHLLEVLRQRLAQPSHPAAKVKCPVPLQLPPQPVYVSQDLANLQLPGQEELSRIPLVVPKPSVRQGGVHGIFATESLICTFDDRQAHGVRFLFWPASRA